MVRSDPDIALITHNPNGYPDGGERDPLAVRRPRGPAIRSGVRCEAHGNPTRHGHPVDIARHSAPACLKCDRSSVG